MASESVLSYYWELASSNEDARIKAADGLVKTLVESQEKYVKEGESEDILCTDLDYSMKRLAKGLASSRKGARQGFATVLAEILHQFKCISTQDIMELLEEHLKVTGNVKSQEERDAYIGHIFGLMSVVRSHDLNTKTKAEECTWLEQVVSSLKQLSEKKTYLREICMKSIMDITTLISYDVFEQHVLPSVKDFVYGGWPMASPDSLVIALFVKKRFEKNLDKKSFKKAWNSVKILDKENYSKLSLVLQESTSVHPNVHCVWDDVLSQLFQDGSECFESFWRIVVDDGLFKSTHDRKYLGFSLISKVLPKLQADQVAMVLSKNVMRSFINNLSSNQSYLHNAAKHLSSSMPAALAENKDPEVTAAVVMQLLGRQGNLQFDKLTKTKTVETLLGKLQESGLENLASWFIECFKNGSVGDTEDERPSLREVDVTRMSILNQILLLSKKKNLDQSGSWRKKILFFLIEMAYFEFEDSDAEGKKMIPLSKQVRDICEQRLFSIIKDLGTPHGRQDKESKIKTSDKGDQKRQWMFTIIKHLKVLLASDDYTVSSQSWTENTNKAFEQSVKVIMKIHKKHKDGTTTPEDEAFELLMSHMVLQLFTEPKQATEILEELKLCYKNRQEKEKGQQSTDEPHWVEVLTEILLSLLTRPSNLLRHVVDEVFTAIAPHLTQDALGIILQAIDPKNVGEEEDENLEVIDASDDEDMDTEDAQEKDDDEDDDNDSSDDDDSDDEDNDGGNEVDEAFRAEVQAALGSAAALPNDDEEESVDDEDLDEESMMQLDDALAAVFKTRAEATKDKKKKKDKSRTILHFKLRVLDIIEIFIKKQSTNPLVLDLVEPLLSLAWTTLNVKDYQTLGERAQGIYRNKLCTIKEHPSLTDINADEIHSCLDTLVRKAMSAPSLNIVTLVTKGCMLLIRVLRGKAQGQPESATKKRKHDNVVQAKETVGGLDVPRVADLFKEALKDFMEKRTTHLHPVLFTELINRFPFLGWELASGLAQNIDSAVNNFRKSQACVMLTSLVSHKTSSYEENLKKLATPLQTTLKSILEESTKSDTTLKAKHFREVLKLMGKFYKEFNILDEEKKIIDSSSVVKVLQKASEGVLAGRSQDIKSTCTRLLTLLEGSSETTQEHNQPKKKKVKKGQPNGTQSSDLTQSSPKQKENKKKKKDKNK